MLDPSGAVYWPAGRLLMVADLHLEKASSLAARGSLLPPFDTRATLEKLQRAVRFWHPERIIALGDSFHDVGGAGRLGAADVARLAAIARVAEFIWISGNHDPAPTHLPGQRAAVWREGPFVFRHQAALQAVAGETEISGHYHPKAGIETRAKTISRPCFVTDAARLILPAYGAYAGGLDVREPAIARLFPRGLRVFLLGQDRLYSFALNQLGRLGAPA